MPCDQSSRLRNLIPHLINQKNILDLGNGDAKERISGIEKFTLRGKDWNGDFGLFIDWINNKYYLLRKNYFGKKPPNKQDKRNLLLKVVISNAEKKGSMKNLRRFKTDTCMFIKPKYNEIKDDLCPCLNPETSHFQKALMNLSIL